MRVTWADAVLAFATLCMFVVVAELTVWQIVGAGMAEGGFPQAGVGEQARALGAAAVLLAAPALVAWFAWRQRLWLTMAVHTVLFLTMSVLAPFLLL